MARWLMLHKKKEKTAEFGVIQHIKGVIGCNEDLSRSMVQPKHKIKVFLIQVFIDFDRG